MGQTYVYTLRVAKKNADQTLTNEEVSDLGNRMNKTFTAWNVPFTAISHYLHGINTLNGQGIFLLMPDTPVIDWEFYSNETFKEILRKDGVLEGLVCKSGHVEDFSEKKEFVEV